MKSLFAINARFHGAGKVLFAWQPGGNYLATAGTNGTGVCSCDMPPAASVCGERHVAAHFRLLTVVFFPLLTRYVRGGFGNVP
jgi:hypothetical protein